MKTCVVCGAKLSKKRLYQCSNANTCDPVCTRARENGITRHEQYFLDDKEDRLLEKQGLQPKWHRVVTIYDEEFI
jgi:hypothetical protein